MQQLCLFKQTNEIKINRWNIYFTTKLFKENEYLSTLCIPSWKFIAKYSIINKTIDTFEIIDYAWYMYLNISMIKNIKTLIWAIIKNS